MRDVRLVPWQSTPVHLFTAALQAQHSCLRNALSRLCGTWCKQPRRTHAVRHVINCTNSRSPFPYCRSQLSTRATTGPDQDLKRPLVVVAHSKCWPAVRPAGEDCVTYHNHTKYATGVRPSRQMTALWLAARILLMLDRLQQTAALDSCRRAALLRCVTTGTETADVS